MRSLRRTIAPIVVMALMISLVGIISVSAQGLNLAVYSSGSMTFDGSGRIQGDAIITAGRISGNNRSWISGGSIYAASGVDKSGVNGFNTGNVKDYTGEAVTYIFKDYNDYNRFPEATYFRDKDTEYKDGTRDLVIGWSGDAKPSGYTIESDSFFRLLKVSSTLTLNINVPSGQLRVIRAYNLEVNGTISINGGGNVILYVDNLNDCGSGSFNVTPASYGDQKRLTIITKKVDGENALNNASLAANIICLDDSLTLNNTRITGNLYVKGEFKFINSGFVKGLVFAPNSKTEVNNSTYIVGRLITKEVKISGNAYVEYGQISGLPSDVAQFIGDKNDSQVFGQDDTSPTAPTTTISQPTEPSQTGQPTTTTPTSPSNPSNPGSGDDQGMVTITVTVARRMSIRLEDGRILKNNDKFTMPKYGTIRYQICTNNWDTDTYSDDGLGICGNQVFEYTHQKNKEKYLRVDNLKHFMPVRFSFAKGNYNKQTGIDKVLSTPLESLSVNLPLGATVTVKAYVKNNLVETTNIFVDSNLEWHYWNY